MRKRGFQTQNSQFSLEGRKIALGKPRCTRQTQRKCKKHIKNNDLMAGSKSFEPKVCRATV